MERIERIAFDIGGTFTDLVVQWGDGRIESGKILSLLDTVGQDIRRSFKLDEFEVGGFIHGTTVAANALLEGKLAPVGLITTRGFRDVLEMRSQRRPNIYDLDWERSKSLIPREWRLEVRERILADGSVETRLDREEAEAVIDKLAAEGVAAIALCLVNSYANPVHERALAEIVKARHPHLAVSVSAVEFSEIREYERSSTTAVNASLMPVVAAYLGNLEKQLGVTDRELLIMQSNGGLMDAGIARHRPVQMVESGPAAGVLAAARLAREVGLKRVLAFDMGGTTAKASLIEDAAPVERAGGEVGGGANLAARFFGGSGHAIRVPAFDIAEVGAGGGSIAWIDPGGALRVGPEGAGAQPGPVCYRRGGERPTVTDANVVLGYVNPGAIADGTVEIDRNAAADAIETTIAQPLGLTLMDAAYGIVQVANATTMRALRSVSIERGVDPRQLTLVGFGGAGPVHAAELAAGLGVGEVYIPPFSGIFSAVGLILADYRYDVVRSLVAPLDRLDVARLERDLAELRRRTFAIMREQGVAEEKVRLSPTIDLQYRGQDIPLTLPLGETSGDVRLALADAFAAAHLAAYGYVRSAAIEMVSLRIRGEAPGGAGQFADFARAAAVKSARRRDRAPRKVWFGSRRGFLETPVVDRASLAAPPRQGPLIVEEWDTSIVAPPEWVVSRDAIGNVVMRRNGGGAS